MLDNPVVRAVLDLYAELDERVRNFQVQTSLQCRNGCGHCCYSRSVEATPLEVLPLAVHIALTMDPDAVLQQLDEDPACVFFQPDQQVPGDGRCTVYPLRPTLCRLFGFAAVRNKHGAPELSVCRRVKQSVPLDVERARQAVRTGLDVVCFADAAQAVAALDPVLAGPLMPINSAVKQALQWVGLRLQMTASHAAGAEPPSPDDDRDPPLRFPPPVRRRVA